jgi:hypothetical protein
MPGPVGNRSDQKDRRKQAKNGGPEDIPVTAVPRVAEPMAAPPLGFVTHDLAMEWYASLSRSAQSLYFEPSDWQTARIVAMELGRMLNAGKPSGQLFTALWTATGDLLSTEGQRRRLRFEIDRAPAGEDEDDDAAIIDLATRLGAVGE